MGGINLKVVEFVLENGDEDQTNRYMLLDKNGVPVEPVMRYIKYLDNTGKKANTLRAYCYHLKLYFEFLEVSSSTYKDVNLTKLGQFIAWLRSEHVGTNIIPISNQTSLRTERTINTIVTCVLGFYDFLSRTEMFERELSQVTQKQISGRFRSFMSFLHHISKGKPLNKNILKLKEPKSKIKTLTSHEVESTYKSTTNQRDQLLIRILYEGGLRISEALNLKISDFNLNDQSIRIRKSKTAAGEERIVYVDHKTMNLFQDYIIDIHDEFDSDYVFLTLKGSNKGKRLSYGAVNSMVKRYAKKSGVVFTPHMLRHTFATELHAQGVDVGVIQRLLGHASVQTTIEFYVHPSDDTIRESYQSTMKNKNSRGVLHEEQHINDSEQEEHEI